MTVSNCREENLYLILPSVPNVKKASKWYGKILMQSYQCVQSRIRVLWRETSVFLRFFHLIAGLSKLGYWQTATNYWWSKEGGGKYRNQRSKRQRKARCDGRFDFMSIANICCPKIVLTDCVGSPTTYYTTHLSVHTVNQFVEPYNGLWVCTHFSAYGGSYFSQIKATVLHSPYSMFIE